MNTPNSEIKTPRTDAVARWEHKPGLYRTITSGTVTVEFARQLEQELQQAREELQRKDWLLSEGSAKIQDLQSQLSKAKEELALRLEKYLRLSEMNEELSAQLSQWQECAREMNRVLIECQKAYEASDKLVPNEYGNELSQITMVISLYTQLTQEQEGQGLSALAILIDLIEDPHNNGDYRLNICGGELAELWSAVEQQDKKLLRLKSLLERESINVEPSEVADKRRPD